MSKKTLRDLNKKQKEILYNESISADLVAMLINMRASDITDIRYRRKFKDNINKASRNYRARIREKEMEKFKKPYGSRMPWDTEEESLLLRLYEEGKSDKEIAKELNRSVYSISKKRERLLKELNNEQHS